MGSEESRLEQADVVANIYILQISKECHLQIFIYNDGDVGVLDPKETKEQVELHNELNDKTNEEYRKEAIF